LRCSGLSSSRAHSFLRAESRFGQTGKADRLRALLSELAELAASQEEDQREVARGRSLIILLPLFVVLGVTALIVVALRVDLQVEAGPVHVSDLMQALDSLVALLLFAIMLVMGSSKLVKAWLNWKSRRALRRIRRVAERINLVQLDKDPERLRREKYQQSAESPQSQLSAWELHRYLSYARNALYLLGFLAFSYVDVAPDDEAEEAAAALQQYIMTMKADVRRKWERVEALREQHPELFKAPKAAESASSELASPHSVA
jgi:ABC-type multidrug transport system fused ATPase/permease subunit